jgi:molybdopterin-binding protein
MNRFEGHIVAVNTHDPLSRVITDLGGGLRLQATVIETPRTAAYLREGSRVAVHFKETEVILCLPGTPGVSEPNLIPGTLGSIEEGVLLTWVGLQTGIGTLGAVIPSESIRLLHLHPGQEVLACIKTTEVMLSEL